MYTASNSALSVFSVQADNQNVVYDASMNVMYLLPFDIRWTSTLGYKYGTVENEKFTPGILNANRAAWNEWNPQKNMGFCYFNHMRTVSDHGII